MHTDHENSQFQRMLEPAMERLKKYTPEELCRKGQLSFDSAAGEFLFPSLGRMIHIAWPSLEITEELEMWHHLTLLQYMDTADGSPLSGRWIGLTELHGGLSRGLSFDREISAVFERDFAHTSAEEFRQACLRLGGEILPGKADVTAKISYAPGFPVLVNFWEADDEFPAAGKALVDAESEHYLTIEAAGGACSAVIREIRLACEPQYLIHA